MAMESFAERLRHAIEILPQGRNFDEKLMTLHAANQEMGVNGVHGTRRTLRRWAEGRGMPPPYWVGLAAEFLGVNLKWLHTGDGVMMVKGRKQPAAPPKGVERTEKAPEPVEKEKVPTKAKRRREIQQEALAKTAAKQKTAEGKEPVSEKKKPEPEVSIPTKDDVLGAKAASIYNFIEKTTSAKAVEAILKHEPEHPKYTGGRKGVLRAAKARLAELKGED